MALRSGWRGSAKISPGSKSQVKPMPVHSLARALLAIERKQARVEGFVTDAAVETEKSLIENLLAALGDHVNDAIAQAQPLIDHRFDFAAAGFGFADDDSMLCSLKRSSPLVSSGARKSTNLPSMRARR